MTSHSFQPRQRAPRRKRKVLYLVAPLLWLIALVIVGVSVKRSNVVEIGLAVALASLVVGFIVLAPQRASRRHREG